MQADKQRRANLKESSLLRIIRWQVVWLNNNVHFYTYMYMTTGFITISIVNIFISSGQPWQRSEAPGLVTKSVYFHSSPWGSGQ